MKVSLNSKILSFLHLEKGLLELFENSQNIAFNQELDEEVLETNFLDSLLESGVVEYDIVAVAVDEENVFVFDLSVSASNTGVFEVLAFVAVVGFNKTDSIFLVLPLRSD